MNFKDGIAPLFEEVFGRNQVSNICNKKTKKRWIWRKKDSIENSDVKFLAWENDFWGTSAEIPYLWRVTTQIWIVLLIDRRSCAWKICFNQSEATNHQYGISVTVSQTTFRGETSGCIGCFLRLSSVKLHALFTSASSEWANLHWGEVNDFYL